MSTPTLTRLAGLALAGGAAVCAAAMLIHPETPRDPLDGPLHTAYFPALLLILLGMPGLIVRQARRAGLLGLIGALGLWAGLAASEVPHAVLDATILPALLSDPSTNALVNEDSVAFTNLMHGTFGTLMLVGEVLLLVGALALPIASLRAAELPRWPSVALLGALVMTAASMAVPAVPGSIGPFLVFAGLAGFGAAVAFNLGPELVGATGRMMKSRSSGSKASAIPTFK